MSIIKKRVLLSVQALVDIAGSELNVLSIAKEFTRMGYEVEIATFRYEDPIKSIMYKHNFNVKNISVEKLDHSEYDLIWAHHFPTIYNILIEKNIRANKIIFSSLSPFEPLEVPPLFVNDLNLCLANSYETKDQLIRENVESDLIYVFPNYAPSEFLEQSYKQRENLKKICIISNHVADELLAAKQLLNSNSIEVDIFGLNHIQEVVTPSLLLNYDAVISIGKTIQFALVMGMPVYCYDIHGGPGWLNNENYNTAKFFNFSGRGFNRHLSPNDIVQELMEGFSSAVEFFSKIKESAKDEFDLTKNLQDLITKIDSMDSISCDDIYRKSKLNKRANKAFIREYEYKNHYRQSALEIEVDNKKLEEINETLNTEIVKLLGQIDEVKKRNEFDLEFINESLNKSIEEGIKTKNECVLLKLELDELKEKNEKLHSEVLQKEKNCIYLSELTEEKNKLLLNMQNTKLWRIGELLRKNKNRLKKGLKDPKIIVRKLRRKGDDFSTKVKVLLPETRNDSNLPLVSVVIPIYDRTDVLKESINSILNQTYQNIEILLVCDGSPHNTVDIVKSYESNPKVRTFFFLNNSGNAVRGRNKAIKEANGEYLAFQDSDDVAESDRIQVSLDFAKKYEADVIYGGWRALLDGSRDVGLDNQQEVFSPDCDYNMLKEICVPCQSTVMVKTSALRFVGGLKPIMRYREDHELWLRLAYHGYKFKAVPKVLTNLRLHANNLELSFKDDDNHWRDLTLEEHTIIRPLKPKIAYLVAGCGISGGLAVILNHLNGLLNRGFDVMIITEDKCESIEWFPNQKVPIIQIDKVPDNLDVVVATYWTTAYTLENIPAVQKYYFVQSDESKFFESSSKESIAARETYLKDYKFITMAKWLKEWLKLEYGKESVYIPNGVDLSIMNSVVPLVEKKGRLRILLEGPIDAPFKCMKEAFEVVKDLDCEVWCISTAGKPDPSWRCDRFFDSVPMDKMKHIYSSCDVLLKMSSVESFCLPALEMMACGGTVVLNRFKGLEEFVVDGHNGLVVDLGDIEGAKRAMNMLIENPELREELSANARETAKQWGWERSIDLLEEMYYPSLFEKKEPVI